MDKVLDRHKYLAVLEGTLNTICFDRASGKRFSFEKLYYPLALDDGKNAFQSYKEQFEQAKKEKEISASLKGRKIENRTLGDGLKDKITSITEDLQKKKNKTLGDELLGKISSSIRDAQESKDKTLVYELEKKNSSFIVGEDNTDKTGNINPEDKKEGDLVREIPDNPGKPVSDEEILGREEKDGNADQDSHEVQVSNKEILERDEPDNSISYFDSGKNDAELGTGEYGLFPEADYEDKHTLSVRTKRVLAIANAGHGKTTLLKRIALFYCYASLPELREKKKELVAGAEEHSRIKKIYGLDDKRDYIPCYIPLRKYDGRAKDFQQILCESVGEVFDDCEGAYSIDTINVFLNKERNNLLLLIDGLDELSSALSESILTLLEEYLESNPNTTVMMTSRVAGVTNPQIMSFLKKLRFIGRSIVPLTDEDAEAYSIKWIEETQEGDIVKANLKKRLSQVLSKEKYNYLKEFMRTPLELLVILKQLANDSLALDRYQLFHDMLFELFTSHERVDKRGILFEDTMSVLGCIAYQMQLRGNLYLSETDLNQIIGSLNALNYHSGIISSGCITDYVRFLDNIAMNIGIVEKERRDGEEVFTFPIRSYQEFLTAHACCHLVVDENSMRPEPFRILSKKIYADEWTKIIIFALADLYTTNQSEFERLLDYVFSNEDNDTRLCSYIESDLEITKEQAKIICERFFESNVLTDEHKKIIVVWNGTKSAYAYNLALKNLFMKSEDRVYSCACAFSVVINSFINNRDLSSFLEDIKGQNPKKCTLAAAIVSECISLFYGESIEGYEETARKQLDLFDGIVSDLYKNAKQYKDFSSIKALTDICIARNYKKSVYREYLDEELRAIALEYLARKEKASQFLCMGKYDKRPDEYYELLEIFTVIGSFPVIKENNKEYVNVSLYSQIVLKAIYELSKNEMDIDQTAIVLAMWCCVWDYEHFIEAWIHDICGEKDLEENYRFVIKKYSSQREQAHFEVLKRNKVVLKAARIFMEIENETLNNINSKRSVFSLFRKRDIIGAARFCIEKLGEEPSATLVNLGFLLRYGKIGKEALLSYSYEDIPELLKAAAHKGDKYALVNLALYYFEKQEHAKARKLLRKLTEDDWREVSCGFWKEELWDVDGDPEGALVCVLAHEYGRCDFDDYEKMLHAVRTKYTGIIDQFDMSTI